MECQQNKLPKESAIPEGEFDEKNTWDWTCIFFKFLIKVLIIKIETQIHKIHKIFSSISFYVKFFFANIFQNILKTGVYIWNKYYVCNSSIRIYNNINKLYLKLKNNKLYIWNIYNTYILSYNSLSLNIKINIKNIRLI